MDIDKILALDIATKTGYYCKQSGGGTWDFKETKKNNGNKKHKHFKDTIYNHCVKYGITQIVCEDVNVMKRHQFRTTVSLSELRGIVKLVADELDMDEPIFIPVSTVKATAGNGKADKNYMIKAAMDRGYRPVDDNHADAIFIFISHVKKNL